MSSALLITGETGLRPFSSMHLSGGDGTQAKQLENHYLLNGMVLTVRANKGIRFM